MSTDADLLHRYIENRSEDAFAELVRRHIGLVYSGALRRVGHDAQLAEDVTQQVFTDLARKAPSLRGHATLAGWLYVSAQLAAANVVRTEQRRKARDGAALTMQTILADSTPAADWDRLRPLLDDLVLDLKVDDREAVVLRFFQQRTFAEIGMTLRLTEEAARKRVDRALDRLRDGLAKRGLTSTAAALSTALTETATAGAPSGLAAKVVGVALANATAAGGGAVAIATLLSMLKSPLSLTTLAAVAGLAVITRQHDANENLRGELARLNAQNLAIAGPRSASARLAHTLADADQLRQAQAELPALRATTVPPPPPVAATPAAAIITVTENNTILWGTEPITLAGFLERLRNFHAQHPANDASLMIRGQANASESSLTYVLGQVRQANITKVEIESVAQPDAKASWF